MVVSEVQIVSSSCRRFISCFFLTDYVAMSILKVAAEKGFFTIAFNVQVGHFAFGLLIS